MFGFNLQNLPFIKYDSFRHVEHVLSLLLEKDTYVSFSESKEFQFGSEIGDDGFRILLNENRSEYRYRPVELTQGLLELLFNEASLMREEAELMCYLATGINIFLTCDNPTCGYSKIGDAFKVRDGSEKNSKIIETLGMIKLLLLGTEYNTIGFDFLQTIVYHYSVFYYELAKRGHEDETLQFDQMNDGDVAKFTAFRLLYRTLSATYSPQMSDDDELRPQNPRQSRYAVDLIKMKEAKLINKATDQRVGDPTNSSKISEEQMVLSNKSVNSKELNGNSDIQIKKGDRNSRDVPEPGIDPVGSKYSKFSSHKPKNINSDINANSYFPKPIKAVKSGNNGGKDKGNSKQSKCNEIVNKRNNANVVDKRTIPQVEEDEGYNGWGRSTRKPNKRGGTNKKDDDVPLTWDSSDEDEKQFPGDEDTIMENSNEQHQLTENDYIKLSDFTDVRQIHDDVNYSEPRVVSQTHHDRKVSKYQKRGQTNSKVQKDAEQSNTKNMGGFIVTKRGKTLNLME